MLSGAHMGGGTSSENPSAGDRLVGLQRAPPLAGCG